MKTFVIPANRNKQRYALLAFEDQAQTVQFDFSPWAEDNGEVTAVTWEVESGSAAVANTSLASNVAEGVITTADVGGSLIKLFATAGNNTEIVYLRVFSKDFEEVHWDYGYR